MSEQPSFTCPRCAAISYHPQDIATGYCGRCHWWTGSKLLGHPDVIAAAEADGAIEQLGRRYVVVLLTANPCPQDPAARCVMEVHGMFTADEATEFAEAQPDWTTPHRLLLSEPLERE